MLQIELGHKKRRKKRKRYNLKKKQNKPLNIRTALILKKKIHPNSHFKTIRTKINHKHMILIVK